MNCQIHAPLSSILCLQAGDSKCRILSAQLLSNLVTCNSKTAQSLSSSVAISPSDKSISSNIENNFSEKQGNDTSKPIEGPNWVDCILSSIKSNNRDAAAAAAAALHNCIVSLDKSNAESWSFIKRLVSDPIFISTILRNIVSAKAPVDEKDNDEWDGATEWFYLLLINLISLGMMSLMYTGISRCPLSEIQSVLPEQNVLLHCMVKQIDENKDTTDFFAKDGKETYTFLANLFCRLRELSPSSSPVDDDAVLLGSAVMSILEILSTILAVDNVQSKELREHLGTVSDILPTCATGLGALVDDLGEKNAGVKAREMKMPLEQQNLITLLVRVLANLCFSCRQNQDLMRTTLVPHTIKQSDTNSKGGDLSRSALHVLLSCTAFSTACFTLREWSVIAIRNVLENNPQNQEVVARLDAQSPVQTAALSEAGLQVQMDSNGKVSLSTLKESDE
jgi:ataxin-10